MEHSLQTYKTLFQDWNTQWNIKNSKCPLCKKNMKKVSITQHFRNRQCVETLKMKVSLWTNVFQQWKLIKSSGNSAGLTILHDSYPEEKAAQDIQNIIGYRKIGSRGIDYHVICRSTGLLMWIRSYTLSKSKVGRMWIKRAITLRKNDKITIIII